MNKYDGLLKDQNNRCFEDLVLDVFEGCFISTCNCLNAFGIFKSDKDWMHVTFVRVVMKAVLYFM